MNIPTTHILINILNGPIKIGTCQIDDESLRQAEIVAANPLVAHHYPVGSKIIYKNDGATLGDWETCTEYKLLQLNTTKIAVVK